MTLTPEQIRTMRSNAGIPEEGIGSSSASDRISQLRQSAGALEAPTTDTKVETKDEPGFIKRAFSEEIQKAGEKTSRLFEEDVPLAERVATAATLPLKAAATTGRIAGRIIAEPVAGVINKAVDFLSDNKFVQAFSMSEAGERISRGAERVSEKLDSSMAEVERVVSPEVFDSVKDAIEVALWIVGEKPATAITKKTAQESLRTGVRVAKEVSKVGVDVARKGIETSRSIFRKFSPKKIVQEAVEGVAETTLRERTSSMLLDTINKINPKKRIQFKGDQGVGVGQWLRERGIIGTREQTVETLVNSFGELRKNVDEALEAIPGVHKDSRITTVAKDSAEYAVATESKLSSRMRELAKKAEETGLDAKEINEVKRFYEREVKLGYMQDATKTSEQITRATNRDKEIREALLDIADEGGFPELRQLNKEIQGSKLLADEIAGKMEGQGANNIMGITDWFVVTPGLTTANPTFLGAFVLKKVFSTETARAWAAKALAKFPEVKSIPAGDLKKIRAKAAELLAKEKTAKVEQVKMALFADELQKSGLISGDTFITGVPMPITRQEQMMLRAAVNKIEAEKVAKHIIEQRLKGDAVGEGFVVKKIENTPILDPQARFAKPPKTRTVRELADQVLRFKSKASAKKTIEGNQAWLKKFKEADTTLEGVLEVAFPSS